ncbi:nitrate reductase molybdenum cofactor assembly chaperone [Geobacillus kaustophilus]|uniref:Nitrate reductase molybdenum cofactor assembly chaperone n=1 Tax=Geobacillus kaustophilus TaxID=1462 RepID=A0A0D8BTP5_GEOKU|nr:nitrate reductase molybdenum cofactor assembly chaperone [Geobacillus kaustophilus]KJE27578.1 nitrate reductase molybdenum cofactor assembly chaperone [Geobacillus kaustophilus]
MNSEHQQTVFLCVSYLLSYPDERWAESLPDCLEAIRSLEDETVRTPLLAVAEHLAATPARERMEQYVETFDFSKKANLYLTYMTNGEQRERGIELVALKARYEAAGFAVSDHELPDYLPLMLEWMAYADQEHTIALLADYAVHIREIGERLAAAGSPYAKLFEALHVTFIQLGVTPLPKGSATAWLANFSG